MSEEVVRQYGCHVCGRLVKDADAVDHPHAGRIHRECARSLSFKDVGGQHDPSSTQDPDAWGGGSASYESD